ncbi:MAG: Gfo/Idh/MocA family oxidoreductase [Geminicoccaceae bacterium]|nr:Gfo/Idh/MocA family oxidoreductase [Geminicoccaceae bacterium]
MNPLQTNKRRVGIVGTGHRGTGTWGRDALAHCGGHMAIVGLSDCNGKRLHAAAANLPEDAVVTTDLDGMLETAKPHTLVVTTRDDTHADIIVKALEAGIDVITEKPMATTAADCRRILEAEKRTGRRVDVAFNYRFAPTSLKIRDLVASGRIGTVTSVDFHWYLDTRHGADYFRRWHAYKRHSGSLFVHKATHHFDLLNWFLDSDPVRVFAQGDLRKYGRNGPFRGERCTGCAHAGECEFFFDMQKDPWLVDLYEEASAEDGYVRDACVYREDIDIYDTMTAAIRYANGVQVSYSLNAYMPIEGYHLAFNGTHGRIEIRMYEAQAFDAPVGRDEILVLGTDRSVERITVEHGPGGHFGGDPLLHRSLYDPEAVDPMGQRAGARAGALSVLTGVAATRSAETGLPVEILSLLEKG